MPRCGEINPAAFTIITYPFLFGVMFGDVGHGLIVLCAGLYFIRNEKKYSAMKEDEIGDILGYPWHGRYVILLMSLFSIYVASGARALNPACCQLPLLPAALCCRVASAAPHSVPHPTASSRCSCSSRCSPPY